VPGPLPAGRLPTAGDTRVIRHTTTQPVRSIKARGMGHSSTRAALIYLHAARERDQAIAAGMGKLLHDAKKGTRLARSGTQRARGRKHAS
jgi:hypothetical protein